MVYNVTTPLRPLIAGFGNREASRARAAQDVDGYGNRSRQGRNVVVRPNWIEPRGRHPWMAKANYDAAWINQFCAERRRLRLALDNKRGRQSGPG